MNKVCIVGGAGYIGKALANCFIRTIYNVTIIDNLSINTNIPKYCTFKNLDINNIDDLNEELQYYDFVIWCSDLHPEKVCDIDTDFTKIHNFEILSQLTYKGHFIYLSDAYLYDNSYESVCLNEENQVNDSYSTYNFYKTMSEIHIKDNFERWTIVRPSNIYGNIDNYVKYDNILNKLVIDGIKKRQIPKLEEDMPLSIVHVKDVASAILKIIEKKAVGIYNISTHNNTFNNIFTNLNNFLNFREFNYVDDNIDYNIYKHIEFSKINSIGFRPEFDLYHFTFDIINKIKIQNLTNIMSNESKYRSLIYGKDAKIIT